MYGYLTKNGYYGRMPSGEWLLFPTEGEYIEEYKDEEGEQ